MKCRKVPGILLLAGLRIRRFPFVGVLILLVILSPTTLGFSTNKATLKPRTRRATTTALDVAVNNDYLKSQRASKVSRQKTKGNAASVQAKTTSAPAAAAKSTTKRTPRAQQQREASPWMKQLLDHDLLSKEDEQRLGIAIQRARKLKEAYSAALQVKLEQQMLQRLQMERLDNSFDDVGDDEDDDLANLSIYDSSSGASDWLADADEVPFQLQSENWRRQPEPWNDVPYRYSGDDSLSFVPLNDLEIATMLQIPGGRSELQKIMKEGAQARQAMLQGNFRLVVSISRSFANRRKYAWGGPNFDEVIQEGILGLATAVDKYQPEMNFRFSTYATWWITNSVRNCFQTHSANIRVPSSYYVTKRKYTEAVKRHLDEGAEVPELDVLAREVGVSVARLQRIIRMTLPLVWLDEPLGTSSNSDGTWDLLDELVDHQMMLPEDHVDLSFLRQSLENAMASELAPHERDVIRLRLGLDDGVKRTVKQVAQEFAPLLSVGDVQQVEKTALKKLRSPHSLSTYKLLTFLGIAGVDQRAIHLR